MSKPLPFRSSKFLSAALLASAIMSGHLVAADYIVSSDQTQSGTVALEDDERFILRNDATLTGLDSASITSDRTDSFGFLLESGTLDNVLLTGESSLFKTTNGEATLNSVASYTGATTVAGGTLVLTQDNALVASEGIMISNGSVLSVLDTEQEFGFVNVNGGEIRGDEGAVVRSRTGFLVVEGSSSATLADAEGASAFLMKVGDGTFHLSAPNTYSGATIIAGGTLSASSSTYALSYRSAVQIGEDGTLDITNSNQFIGSLGDYTVGEDGWGGYVNMEYAYLITGYDNTDTTFSGEIYGGYNGSEDDLASGLWKVGDGTWTLEGAIYGVNGIYNIDGAFFNNGYIDAVEVFNDVGGVFGGSGEVSAWMNFINEGTLLPGTEFDTGALTIYGDFIQTRTGNTVIRARSRADYSQLFVSGNVFLDGKLILAYEEGYRPSAKDQLAILITSGDIQGSYTSIKVAGGRTMLRPYLSEDFAPEPGSGDFEIYSLPVFDTALIVNFEQESFGKIPGLTPNQRAVGGAIDSAVRRGELRKLIDGLNEVDYDDVPTALSILSPEQLSAIYQIGFANARTQFNNIERRLEDARRGVTGFSANGLALRGAPSSDDAQGLSLAGFDGKSLVSKNPVAPIVEESRWSFFATGTGEWADIETTNQARGSEFSTGGVTVGADYRVNDNLIVGLAGSYVHTGSDLWDGGRVKLDGGKGAIFATLFNDNAWLNASVGGAYNSYDTRRSLGNSTARGNTEGGEFDALLGGGYTFQMPCGFRFGPVASLEYVYLGLNSFQENGSPAPLHFPTQHQDSLRSALGVQASYDWNVGGVVITPEVRVRWAHEYLDSTAAIVSRFVGASSTFRVDGPSIGRDSLIVDAGASVQINPTWSVYANYSGELFRTNYSSNSVSGGFRVSF